MPVECVVRGVLANGKAMCGEVMVGGKYCCKTGACEHQRLVPPAPYTAEELERDSPYNQFMNDVGEL